MSALSKLHIVASLGKAVHHPLLEADIHEKTSRWQNSRDQIYWADGSIT